MAELRSKVYAVAPGGQDPEGGASTPDDPITRRFTPESALFAPAKNNGANFDREQNKDPALDLRASEQGSVDGLHHVEVGLYGTSLNLEGRRWMILDCTCSISAT